MQPLWRTVWRFLKKLKIELPYDPAIPLLGIYPETKTLIQKRYRHPYWAAPQRPTRPVLAQLQDQRKGPELATETSTV